jgi:hypothetical protein
MFLAVERLSSMMSLRTAFPILGAALVFAGCQSTGDGVEPDFARVDAEQAANAYPRASKRRRI